ncbi:MAG: glycosyltransferase family 4 protein [Anaerolineales bacterium]
MDIGLIIYDNLGRRSGGYLYDRKLVEHLRTQGDRVKIISLPGRNYPKHLSDNLSKSLLQQLTQETFDVLLQDELNHPSLFWLNRRIRRHNRQDEPANYPLISIVHHLRSSEGQSPWQKRFYRWVERWYLNSVDGFIFNSQTTRRSVETLAIEGRPSVVAYPGKDHLKAEIQAHEIAQRVEEPGPLRILFIGNVIPRKGLHTILDALRSLPPEMCRLTVVGSLTEDPVYANTLLKQVNQMGLGGRVEALGSISDGELSNQLQQHQLLVMPSSYEGFGIAYLEAMGFGLPVIGTQRGGASEIITSGENGYLIAPQDSEALTAHLQELHQDPQRLLTMSLAARQRYQAHPTWKQSGERIRSFLKGLAQSKKKDGEL